MLKNNEKSFEIIVAIITCLAIVGTARADRPEQDKLTASDPCLWPSYVWRFTTQEYKVIDDFEVYTGTVSGANPLVDTWQDRHTLPEQGGEVWLVSPTEPGPVHGGQQAMKFEYYPYYGISVTRRTYADDEIQDWSDPFKALVLWFYGKPIVNFTPADGMYVTLKDSDAAGGDEATVHYGDAGCVYEGAGDTCDLIAEEWLKWGIPLAAFEAGGVDLDQIKSITLGATPDSGGQFEYKGYIYFDDLRLYGRACLPEYSWRYGDFTGPEGVPDCFVDGEDLKHFASCWLDIDAQPNGIPDECDICDIHPPGGDGEVNFKDFAVLSDNWLMDAFWP